MPEAAYYFNSKSTSVWTDSAYMIDNILTNYASTASGGDTETLDGNTCPGTDLGIITRVELRVYAYGDANDRIDLTPVFPGGDGDEHETTPGAVAGWGYYQDITSDTNAPSPWTWAAVQAVDVKVEKANVSKGNMMYCSKVEIRVVYFEPPISDIDVGSFPVVRETYTGHSATFVDKNNPANASGTLQSVKVYARMNMSGLVVGTFYTTDGNTLRCRDSEYIGDVEKGAERTFTGLSITVLAGDYIGCYFTGGYIQQDTAGSLGYWWISGEYIDPNDEATYTFYADRAISLYGFGDFEAPPPTFIPTVAVI